jgi:hypothetical protein
MPIHQSLTRNLSRLLDSTIRRQVDLCPAALSPVAHYLEGLFLAERYPEALFQAAPYLVGLFPVAPSQEELFLAGHSPVALCQAARFPEGRSKFPQLGHAFLASFEPLKEATYEFDHHRRIGALCDELQCQEKPESK